MRFEQKVIHSLDELRKSRPCPISERVCTFSLGLFNSPKLIWDYTDFFFRRAMMVIRAAAARTMTAAAISICAVSPVLGLVPV